MTITDTPVHYDAMTAQDSLVPSDYLNDLQDAMCLKGVEQDNEVMTLFRTGMFCREWSKIFFRTCTDADIQPSNADFFSALP